MNFLKQAAQYFLPGLILTTKSGLVCNRSVYLEKRNRTCHKKYHQENSSDIIFYCFFATVNLLQQATDCGHQFLCNHLITETENIETLKQKYSLEDIKAPKNICERLESTDRLSTKDIVVPTGGLEPPIFGLGDRRLIH